jgi:uncharacterized phiE125 gp8 family phage protein
MRSFRVREPAIEPVALDEAKLHLRVSSEDEDTTIAGLIAAARGFVEDRTRRALIDQGWRTVLDAWPASATVILRPPPVTAIEGVTLYDALGEATNLGPESWRLVAGTGPATLTLGLVDPGRAANGIEIDYATGYGATAAEVPAPLRHAVLMLVAHWFENREAASLGIVSSSVALGVDALVGPYRVVRL